MTCHAPCGLRKKGLAVKSKPMKTICPSRIRQTLAVFALSLAFAAHGQTLQSGDSGSGGAGAVNRRTLPTDLQETDPSSVSRFGYSWFSIQRFPFWPPNPCNWLADQINLALYVSPSWGTNDIFVDDRGIDYVQRAAENELLRLASQAADGLA